ncbi:MAG: GTPase HflX [Candidatus Sumerlaeia bacterium]
MRNEFYETEAPPIIERAVLVGLQREGQTPEEAQLSLEELERLVDSAGAEILDSKIIRLREPNPATLISKGHVENLVAWTERLDADMIVLDDETSPVQQRNLEKAFGCRTVTRTEVILDIFATHAQTRESMTQVELAQLQYRRSRLIGIGIASAKMGGTGARIATRGPGETQLEVDRRRIRERVQHLEKTLKTIQKQRAVQRQRRQQSGMPLIGIAGYTNAGKSTLLNTLTQTGALAEDKLFATLDTTVRSLSLPGGLEVGLIDTVGFVSKLPTELVAAFRATLEEIAYADLILHVVDSTSPRLDVEFQATREIFETLNCQSTPRLTVWNKIDLLDDPIQVRTLPQSHPPAVAISARENIGIDTLLAEIERIVMQHNKPAKILIPYDHYELVARVHREATVLDDKDRPEGKFMECLIPEQLEDVLEPYRLKSESRVEK